MLLRHHILIAIPILSRARPTLIPASLSPNMPYHPMCAPLLSPLLFLPTCPTIPLLSHVRPIPNPHISLLSPKIPYHPSSIHCAPFFYPSNSHSSFSQHVPTIPLLYPCAPLSFPAFPTLLSPDMSHHPTLSLAHAIMHASLPSIPNCIADAIDQQLICFHHLETIIISLLALMLVPSSLFLW